MAQSSDRMRIRINESMWPSPLSKELAELTKPSMDQMKREINRQFLFGTSNTKKKDDVAITAMDYHDVAKEVWDSKSLSQLYGANPFTITKTATIPLEKKTMKTSKQLRKEAKALRREAERIEQQEKQARRDAKERRKRQAREAARADLAKETLAEIAADKKARKEDRVEAARVLLDRGY